MDTFGLYKELYHKENDRRNEVQNALNIPIAIISAILTGVYFLLTNFDYKLELRLSYFFIGLCLLTIVFILNSIYFLVRAFSDFTKGYEYSGLAYPQELYNWNIELENYYKQYGNSDDASITFEKHIIENLVKHTDHNMFINDKKYGYIYNSKKYLISGLITILFAMFPFGYNYIYKKENIQKLELLNIDKNELEKTLLIRENNNINLDTNAKRSTKTTTTTTTASGQTN